jgi:8-oxo-dGTP pyrophosphatase MutT (NUDIX family)
VNNDSKKWVEPTADTISGQLRKALARRRPNAIGHSDIPFDDTAQFKCAAVLIPLVPDGGGWKILYTRRTNRVESHKGQVSFPGGACDEGERTAEETALRECFEEIGVNPADVRVLGRLADMVTITSYRVTPVVGVIPWPLVFRLEANEVDRVFTIPLQWLADRRNRWEFPFPGRAGNLVAFHPFDGELLWGATARMTVDFLQEIGLAKA